FYLFGELKPGGWWYYFLVAFAFKATLPVVVFVVVTAVEATRGFVDRWGEMILLVSIALFLVATSIFAGQVGVRYILPVFPLVFVWVSRIVPRFLAARSGTVVLAALVAWKVYKPIDRIGESLWVYAF